MQDGKEQLLLLRGGASRFDRSLDDPLWPSLDVERCDLGVYVSEPLPRRRSIVETVDVGRSDGEREGMAPKRVVAIVAAVLRTTDASSLM